MKRYYAILPRQRQPTKIDGEAVETIGITAFSMIGCTVSGLSDSSDDAEITIGFPDISFYLAFENGAFDKRLVCCACKVMSARRRGIDAALDEDVCCTECDVKDRSF